MKQLFRFHIAGVFLAAMSAISAHAVITVTPQEMAGKDRWVQQHLLTASNLPPFSFIYAGQSSSLLLPSWGRTETDTVLDSNRTQHVLTWTTNGLQVKCVAVEYNDYPVVEWTVWFKDIGTNNTPILQDIQGLDTIIKRTNGPEFLLHTLKGDSTTPDSYEPYQITLGPSSVANFSPLSGKSSSGPKGWPYYDLQMPGGGIILAIGWPGQWASSFRDVGSDLEIKAGQQLTHLYLKPGEQIRTPLILLLFWQGTSVIRAQNIWRHFYLAHIIPRINGHPPAPITTIQVSGADTNAVNAFLQAGIHPDVCWRDAGAGATTWYPSGNGPYKGEESWLNTGTWEVDPAKYPRGFKPFSDWIHAQGMKFLLWFEPERVGNTNNSFLATNNPAWLLPGTGSTVGDILNEGNPAVFNWLTNHMETLIKSNGVDWYREDMNGNGPLPAWRKHDAKDREGITENFYVQGHLAYWDALLAMNPHLRIDSCASGGRRNDLETMRRAVPLARSDFQMAYMKDVVNGNQCQTYGLSFWLPYQGSGCRFLDPYSFRSFYMAEFGMCEGLTPANKKAQIQAYTEDKNIAPIMLNGDYYPLTPYSLANNVWIAWQFDWSKKGEGCVQIWRRTKSPVSSMTFQLHGLNPTRTYDVSNFDTGDLGPHIGSELMSTGLTIQLNPRQSAILYYHNARAHGTKGAKVK